MASLTLKKDCKNWIACFGRTQRSTGISIDGDKKVAQKIADEFEEAARLAHAGMFNEARARKVLNDILERAGQDKMHTDTVENFLRDWVKGKDNEGTNESYSKSVELFLETLGAKAKGYLTNVDHKDIQKFRDTRQGWAPATIRLSVKTLNIAFGLAKKLHFIQDNPVEKSLALNPIKGGSMEKHPFTHEQVKAILKKADGEWTTAILFGYFTGARLTDCARFRWKNVNFEKKVLQFVAKKTGHKNEEEEVHTMPLAPELEAHLLKIPSADDDDSFITPELAAKDTRGRNGLSESFKRIMVKAGVDPQEVQGKGKKKFSKLSFHSLRHGCNSLLANADVDQETRMKLIGWKSKDINDGYTHVEIKTLRDALAKLPPLI
jgi:integrase